jgi:rhodanese-related sulfurtransferase
MGTVHGVYLKYVGLSALSYAGYSYLLGNDGENPRSLHSLLLQDNDSFLVFPVLCLGYSTLLNGFIALLFKLESGMGLVGKDRKKGSIPWWSYLVFAPFHLPTMLYTHFHTRHSKYTPPDKKKKEVVPVASMVQPGWYVGGCYSHELDKEWACVIDLTVEFPESCIETTKSYLSMPAWDGVPATPEQLEEAATFAMNAKQKYGNGDVLVHCAHGRGRSTTVMCACLVKAGLFNTWEEAFEMGIKPGRSVCKLNKRMRENLEAWQAKYYDGEGRKTQ